MANSGRNYDHSARFQRLLRRDPMRTGYVLVSEEQESGSEYSGSTCCCSSCASTSCSSSESSDEEDDDDDDDDAYLSDCSACWARRDALRRGRAGWREGGDGGERRAEERDVSFFFLFLICFCGSCLIRDYLNLWFSDY